MIFRTTAFRLALAGAGTLVAAAVACSASNSDSGAGGSSAGGGGAGAGGSTSGGGTSGSGAGIGFGATGGGGAGGGGGIAGGCAKTSASAAPSAANVLILLDMSGSMSNVIPFPLGTRWSLTHEAFKGVIPSLPPELWMGLVYFGHPKDVPGCSLGGCCTRDFSNGGPDVPILPLDSGQKSTLTNWMNLALPDNNNNTPTHDALAGAYDILTKAKLDGSLYVLMLTDGAENCGGDSAKTIAEAGAAASGSPAVKTFVVGSPGSDNYRQTLSDIAKAGGTARTPTCTGNAGDACHYDLSTAGNFQTELTDALTKILGSVKVPCEYTIPDQDGGAFDPNLVNVNYSSGGQPAQPILQDTTKSCDQAAGWQYSPDGKKILLCGSTCSAVQSDPNAVIEIVFGCPTQKVK
jgi:hypothetical protein